MNDNDYYIYAYLSLTEYNVKVNEPDFMTESPIYVGIRKDALQHASRLWEPRWLCSVGSSCLN